MSDRTEGGATEWDGARRGLPFSPILFRGEGARRADEGRKISEIRWTTAPHPALSPMKDQEEEELFGGGLWFYPRKLRRLLPSPLRGMWPR